MHDISVSQNHHCSVNHDLKISAMQKRIFSVC